MLGDHLEALVMMFYKCVIAMDNCSVTDCWLRCWLSYDLLLLIIHRLVFFLNTSQVITFLNKVLLAIWLESKVWTGNKHKANRTLKSYSEEWGNEERRRNLYFTIKLHLVWLVYMVIATKWIVFRDSQRHTVMFFGTKPSLQHSHNFVLEK